MNSIEARLRASLRVQADEVEPSQDLWRETNRRIDRRTRQRVLGWSLAGVATAAAAVVGVLVVSELSAELPIPEVAGVPDGEELDDGAGASVDPGEDGEGPVARTPPLLTASDAAIELRSAEGQVLDRLELPAEGDSSVMSLAVRPGSTPGALTAAVLTEAEGMVDLRVVRRDVDGFTIEVFAPAYRPSTGVDPAAVSGPVFSPDGSSLAWLEGGQVMTLRTIGWDDDGPGTGEPATDNAAFVLDGAPTSLRLHDWVAAAESDGFVLRASDAGSTSWFEIPLLRQADGAWAREPGAGLRPVDAPDDTDTAGHVATLTDGSLSVSVR